VIRITKPGGWFGESKRHSLAAKGIKTIRKKVRRKRKIPGASPLFTDSEGKPLKVGKEYEDTGWRPGTAYTFKVLKISKKGIEIYSPDLAEEDISMGKYTNVGVMFINRKDYMDMRNRVIEL